MLSVFFNSIECILINENEHIPDAPFLIDEENRPPPCVHHLTQPQQFFSLLRSDSAPQTSPYWVIRHPWSSDWPKPLLSLANPISAAGGVVHNSQHQWLLIFRKKRWDLPKGKIDPGETPVQAAVREVQEETGLIQVVLNQPEPMTIGNQPFTLHLYNENNRWHLKTTFWFLMHADQEQLKPQEAEDISAIGWFDWPQAWVAVENSYPLVRKVLLTARQLLPGHAGQHKQ